MTEEGPAPKGYRRVVTDDGRVIYVPQNVEDFLVAARSVVTIRKGRQHPPVFDGVFLSDGAMVVAGPRSFRVVSNDMNVEYLPDRETFFIDLYPVPTAGVVNPELPLRNWHKVPRRRRRR